MANFPERVLMENKKVNLDISFCNFCFEAKAIRIIHLSILSI